MQLSPETDVLTELCKVNGIDPAIVFCSGKPGPKTADAGAAAVASDWETDVAAACRPFIAQAEKGVAAKLMSVRLLAAAVVSGGVVDGPLTPPAWSSAHADAICRLVRVTHGLLGGIADKIERLPRKRNRLEHVLASNPPQLAPFGRAVFSMRADLYTAAPTRLLEEVAGAMRGKLPSVVRAMFAHAVDLGLMEQVCAVLESEQWLRADNPYRVSVTLDGVVDSLASTLCQRNVEDFVYG
jgi:hypothetical protein